MGLELILNYDLSVAFRVDGLSRVSPDHAFDLLNKSHPRAEGLLAEIGRAVAGIERCKTVCHLHGVSDVVSDMNN
jgi:hypothetical protein